MLSHHTIDDVRTALQQIRLGSIRQVAHRAGYDPKTTSKALHELLLTNEAVKFSPYKWKLALICPACGK